MINIEEWMNCYKQAMLDNFKDRILFIGLQGSYARGEATESSDIDTVVIFDYLKAEDLKKYDEVISELPYREMICGFVSGKDELVNWEKSDLFQFYYDTKPVYGNLDFIFPLIKKENVRQAVLIGVCNIYHACCHNTIHEKDFDILKALYKQAVFVLQAKYFCDTDCYIVKKSDLSDKLGAKDRHILNLYFSMKAMHKADETEFSCYADALFAWSGSLIKEYGIQ